MGFLQFVRLYGNTRAKLRVLFSMARHPRARFDRHAFSVSPDGYHLDLSEGLEELVAEGVVEHPCPQGFSLYSLADNAEKRQPVLELAGLDLGQAQVLACPGVEPRGGPIPSAGRNG
jgi:hypothetical protein